MMTWLTEIAIEVWRLALEMAPYVVIGLLAAIAVFAVFPKDKIQRWLGKPGWSSTVKAALAGIPLPLCSCGVLPTAMSLRQRGASRGATLSFLVSTPETGLDSIAVTYALINPLMTILRPVAAFLSAVTTGFAVDRLAPEDSGAAASTKPGCMICGDDECTSAHPWGTRLGASARYIAFDFFPDIANWLVIGLILSGILAALIPDGLFAGRSAAVQMALVVIAGVPMYICASASTPIAAVLLAKGMAPGAALVFLLVGPATNIASLLVLGHLLGRRTAMVYLGSVILTSVVIGILVNVFFGNWNWIPNIAVPHSHEGISLFHSIGLALLLASLAGTWLRRLAMRRRKRHSASTSPVGA